MVNINEMYSRRVLEVRDDAQELTKSIYENDKELMTSHIDVMIATLKVMRGLVQSGASYK